MASCILASEVAASPELSSVANTSFMRVGYFIWAAVHANGDAINIEKAKRALQYKKSFN